MPGFRGQMSNQYALAETETHNQLYEPKYSEEEPRLIEDEKPGAGEPNLFVTMSAQELESTGGANACIVWL